VWFALILLSADALGNRRNRFHIPPS
jgi:hypothetical protein